MAGVRGNRFGSVASRGLALAALLLVGCGDTGGGPGARTPTTAEGEPPLGGTAVVGLAGEPTTLFPLLVRSALEAEISGLLHLGLNRAAWEGDSLAFPEAAAMDVVRGWRLGPEGRSLTYRLDPEARWSDGRPVVAADASFTFDLLADAELGLPLSYVTEELEEVTTRGDTAVTLRFRRRYPGMLFDTGVGLVPSHALSETPRRRLATAPPGADSIPATGPFRVAEWRRGDRLVLVRNRASHVAPRLDTLVFRVLPEETTRLQELRTGGIHVAQVTSHRRAVELAAVEGIRVERIPQRGYEFIAWNPGGHPAFESRQVRRALSLSLDRQALLGALDLQGFASPARGPYGGLFPDLASAGAAAGEADYTEHDPERARRLLREAGWRLPEGGSVRERDGRRLEFELAVPVENARRRDAAEIIQAQLAEVGVRARVRTEEFNALFARMREGSYEAALLGWQTGLDRDLGPFFYDAASPLNVVDYETPEVRAAIDSARAAPTRTAADRWWARAAGRITADQPYAFLWHLDQLVAVGPGVHGVEADPLGFLPTAHRWWVER